MSDELKPCPFCNETPRISALLDGLTHIHHICHALGFRVETSFASKAEAAAAWNTRAPQPAASVDREALVELLHKSFGGPFFDGFKEQADAMIAAGWHNRPEAVVRDEALRDAADVAHTIDADKFNATYRTDFNRKRYDQDGVKRATNRALNIQAEDARDAILALRTAPLYGAISCGPDSEATP